MNELTTDDLLVIANALRTEKAEAADLLTRGFGHQRTVEYLDELIEKVEHIIG
ncbi:hypothetical protein [Citricoccus sp. I39-566]|uniref:hypothetical protein n=1 Tax=Citricoccus sp. I39-566 TaxID=3073268 RepID=UPI00286BD2AB|nr:hypothetical protein [Citricoccus sp. I39-566]WMY79208.1 hypothetical protein RE421_04915 [Citricoccus sp. I39-566]